MQQQSERSRMLGEMPMRCLVPKVGLPIMVSMIVQAMYNVVDSIFVARYNPNALTAVSLAYPVQMLMIALSVGMGVGISSLLSRKLGAGQRAEARRAAWNGLMIEGAGSLLFMIIGLFLTRAILGALVSDNTLAQDQAEYYSLAASWTEKDQENYEDGTPSTFLLYFDFMIHKFLTLCLLLLFILCPG